ncbi:hypothetical protein B0T13DRAFT_310424 [Neurospora crassa]|nr:hypothetical protein B0T13DRAFT_310424 [Neurospora crassa]
MNEWHFGREKVYRSFAQMGKAFWPTFTESGTWSLRTSRSFGSVDLVPFARLIRSKRFEKFAFEIGDSVCVCVCVCVCVRGRQLKLASRRLGGGDSRLLSCHVVLSCLVSSEVHYTTPRFKLRLPHQTLVVLKAAGNISVSLTLGGKKASKVVSHTRWGEPFFASRVPSRLPSDRPVLTRNFGDSTTSFTLSLFHHFSIISILSLHFQHIQLACAFPFPETAQRRFRLPFFFFFFFCKLKQGRFLTFVRVLAYP